MKALLVHDSVRADHCQASRSHAPEPLRFVWHHIQPHEAGGPTESANLVQLCDSCHYSVHRLLWYLRCEEVGVPLDPVADRQLAHPPRRELLILAREGFSRCEEAGTIDQIPNEG